MTPNWVARIRAEKEKKVAEALAALKTKSAAPAQVGRSLPIIAESLMTLGYSDADIQGIMGHNNLRVARAVWRTPGNS